MSKNENPKKVLKKRCFLEGSEHNDLNLFFRDKNIVMIIILRKNAAIFYVSYN
jgi:hypothetical protein